MKFQVLIFIAVFFQTGSGVRISPKIDFDSSPGIRTDFNFPKNSNRVSYQTVDANNNDVVIKCVSGVPTVSGGCNTTGGVSSNGVATDVIVHVQTNVNVPKVEAKETASEVPIIVGTNRNSQGDSVYRQHPVYNNNPRPVYNNQQPVYNQQNVPNFVPSYQNVPVYNTGFQPTTYRWPQLTWHQKQKGIVNYHNPLEFKKIYTNTWPSLKIDFVNQFNLPKLNVNCCLYPNHPSNVNPQSRPSHIDGKIAPLNK